MRSVSLLGSTGSIGASTLDVIGSFPERFRVVALAAGRRVEDLARQAERFSPELVSLEREEDASRFRSLFPGFRGQVRFGREGLLACATAGAADTVVAALVGAVGVASAHAAVCAGKRLALANKETLVVAGEMIRAAAARAGAEIIPIDSEHSALHQALRSGRAEEVRRLVVTGSGGPFRLRPLATFSDITVEDALHHPTWKMGPKITIDSATMMNKGLEILEAHFLFGIDPSAIDVVLHPQSIVHSMVEFRDGSILAQMSCNDMRLPILYALGYPERLESPFGRLCLEGRTLEFEPFDPERYPAVGLARAALSEGGGAPAVLNAANEVAVAAFLGGRIRFPSIVRVVAETRAEMGPRPAPATVHEAEEIDAMARRTAHERVERHAGVGV
jgi:1-deoxy-D-xylulose-5-phosphate reductoisomerase